jgi:hypothetical protein
MVKANGMPYTSLAERGEWAFYCSTKANPLLLMLEFIWTRLNEEYGIIGLWGEDLELEVMHAYFSAHVQEQDGKFGWAITYCSGADSELNSLPVAEEWMPTFLTSHQAAIIAALCKGKSVNFSEPSLLDWLTSEGINPSEFWERLLDTRLVAANGTALELVTESCVVSALPDGQFVAADDNTGRLTRWMAKRYPSEVSES